MPCLSAGSITVRTWSSRAAANSSVSASGPSSLPMPDNTRCLMISAPGDPPGSRVTMVRSLAAFRRSASVLIWVDLPEPSPPSKVIKRPRPGGLLIAASAISELLGAEAKHSDHEFARAVDRAPHRRALADRIRRVDRRLHGDVSAAPHPDDADLLAGFDGGANRTAVDHARDQFVVAVLLYHHLDRLGARKPDRAAVAAEHLGIADRLLRGEQCPRLEIAESPFQHLLGLGGAVIRILEAVDDADQADAVLHGRADHAVAALVGKSGLQPVGARQRGQERIAVLLADLVPGELLLAEQLVELGIGLDDVARQFRKLAHRHLVAGIGQPVGIGEGRLRQPKFAGALGHEVGSEGALVAGHAFGERDAGI